MRVNGCLDPMQTVRQQINLMFQQILVRIRGLFLE